MAPKHKKTLRWQDVKDRDRTPEKIDALDRAVEQELLEMDLRAIRQMLGVTQQQLAGLIEQTQSEISRLERRADHRLSTLRRIVESLGGEIEIMVTIDGKRIKLKTAG